MPFHREQYWECLFCQRLNYRTIKICPCQQGDKEKWNMALPEKNFNMVQKAIRDLLVALGEDPNREGLQDTPRRVAKMYSEILDGNFAEEKPMTGFAEESYKGIVMVTKVPFYAFCEHHLALFHGRFAMGYVPNKKVLGLSKLVRIFRYATKRVTIQERITDEAIKQMYKHADPAGAICFVEAEHTCMTLRGTKSPGSMTSTLSYKGVFETDAELRQTFVQQASK
jgi:GTP cyclohydrolase IA